MQSPITPNKKRRFDYGPPPIMSSRRTDEPYYTQYASRRESLPPIQARYSPPNSATMPPPRTPRDGRRGSLHEPGHLLSEPSPRMVQEVLSTFPYLTKIKLLGRIAPPYRQSSSDATTAVQNRGAILAVEGDDIDAVVELSSWLNDYLVKQDDFKPLLAQPPKSPDREQKASTFEDYLELIKEWHGKSREMIEYMTMSSTPAIASQGSDGSDKDSASSADSPPPASSFTSIIILPTFQLQASVAYASQIPIQDAYSATDHWQWMATLWRGIIGPDLTIYVKTYDGKDGFTGSKPKLDDVVRCLTVYKDNQGEFTSADLRRVGFEVNEYIKGMKG